MVKEYYTNKYIQINKMDKTQAKEQAKKLFEKFLNNEIDKKTLKMGLKLLGIEEEEEKNIIGYI